MLSSLVTEPMHQVVFRGAVLGSFDIAHHEARQRGAVLLLLARGLATVHLNIYWFPG